MSSSMITKQAIAHTFKALMRHYPINKITVKMIVDECGVTRHTFYNHFHDIYELLEWIYDNEVIEELDQTCNIDHWQKGISLVLCYTYENRVICSNTCRSLGREHLERFLHQIFETMIEGVISDIHQDATHQHPRQKEIASFYAYAITGEFLQWIIGGFSENPETVKDRIVYMLNGTIRHLIQTKK